MRLDWFQLPGPSAFIDLIVNDLRQGKSVVITVGETGPRGILRAIKNSMSHDSFNWVCISPLPGDPLETLYKTFYPDKPPELVPSLSRLFSLPNFQSTILEVQISSIEVWKHWINFLEEFAYFSRSQDTLLRSQLLLLINRCVGKRMPKPDIFLSIHNADDVSTILDMRIYAFCLSEKSSRSVIRRELVASISAELSLWDRTLCERLCSVSLPTLLEPTLILLNYAYEHKWEKLDLVQNIESLREAGAIQTFGDKEEAHSSLLALRGESLLITRRLWHGQISVLFPLIESQRQELLDSYKHLFDLPHRTPNGNLVNDCYDLDWGNICFQIRQKRAQIDDRLYQRIMSLREARNALAHMDLVPLGILEKLLSE